METENKIVRLFIEEAHPKTIREIAKNIYADYKITHTAVQRLLKAKILLFETVGKSTLCKRNPAYYGIAIYEAENERRESMLKNANLKQLYKEIMQKIGTSLFVCLLFGSYAKGNQTKASDIDLLFVINNKDAEEKITRILSLLPLKTHALVFTEEEFIRMKDTKKTNVIQEAIGKNTILYGIEAYYRLKNA